MISNKTGTYERQRHSVGRHRFRLDEFLGCERSRDTRKTEYDATDGPPVPFIRPPKRASNGVPPKADLLEWYPWRRRRAIIDNWLFSGDNFYSKTYCAVFRSSDDDGDGEG